MKNNMPAKSLKGHLGGSASGGKNKKLFIIIALLLLAAGCNPFSKTLPVGIIKSVNGGADWQFSNAVASSTTLSLATLNISTMAFDPQNSQTVFAGAYNGGLYKSTDSGATWSDIFPNKIFVYDFAISPDDSKTIYAAGFYGNNGRVAKTTDGGASWIQVYNEASTNNAVRAIALNPTNPNEILIGTASGTVIKSSDAGTTWQLVKNFSDQVNRVLWQNNIIYVLLKAHGLYESADQGVTFTAQTSTLGTSYNLAGLSYTSNPISSFSQVYADFLDSNLIYITTDKGLYKTTDNGKTWNLMSLPLQPSQSTVHAIAVSRSNSSTVYTSVNATVYKSLDGGNSWQTQEIANAGGFVNYILIDPNLPQIVYGGVYSSQ